MKKIIILLLLLSSSLYADSNNIITFGRNTSVSMNDAFIEYFTNNLFKIEYVNNETVICVPIEKEFKKNNKAYFYNGSLVGFDYDYNSKEVTLKKDTKTKYYEFDFEKKKIKVVNQNNDNKDFLKLSEKELKEKIKDKMKNKTGNK